MFLRKILKSFWMISSSQRNETKTKRKDQNATTDRVNLREPHVGVFTRRSFRLACFVPFPFRFVFAFLHALEMSALYNEILVTDMAEEVVMDVEDIADETCRMNHTLHFITKNMFRYIHYWLS